MECRGRNTEDPSSRWKTTGLIAPNVAEWDGPVLLTTTKIPDLALIHARRSRMGPVWVLAPGGAPGYETAGWSPVDYAVDPEAADRVADWLVEASGLSVDPKSRPWLVQARKYLKPLLLAAHLSGGGVEAFLAWVEHILALCLHPGEVVILDRLRVHQVEGVAKLIAARGAYLEYLPPYSPDLNPIEKVWSKLKAALRTAKARTGEALEAALREALDSISTSDIRAWFEHCGYAIR